MSLQLEPNVPPVVRPREERGVFAHEPGVYGHSVQGRPLEVWLPANRRPRMLVLAGVHGEEAETTVLASAALRTVAPDSLTAGVVLAANPDGIARGTRGNVRGIDLNRNFPSPNWVPAAAFHRWTCGDRQDVRLSSGDEPASEPETAALIELVEELEPDIVLALHGPLACVIDPGLSPLGRCVAEETQLPLVASIPFPTHGSLGSWLYSRGIGSVTLELPVIAKDVVMRRYLDVVVRLLAGELDEGRRRPAERD